MSTPTRRSVPALLAALALVATVAQAAPPSEASIAELLTVTKTERTLDTMFASLDGMMRQSAAVAAQRQKLTTEQQRALEATIPRLTQVMRDELSWKQMQPLYTQVYRESFTQEDVDGLLAFYRSPAGIAYVDKMPAVLQKTMTLMQARMGPMMERMQAAITQAAQDAKSAK